MECRTGCGACCIALSISSPMPGLPNGKPAGVRCPHLTTDYRCALFGLPERPTVCTRLRPLAEMCGENRDQALAYLEWLEHETAPGGSALASKCAPGRQSVFRDGITLGS